MVCGKISDGENWFSKIFYLKEKNLFGFILRLLWKKCYNRVDIELKNLLGYLFS